MNGRDLFLAALVPLMWGLNFPASAILLAHYPPLLGAAIRFALIAVPTLLFVPRPQIPVIWLLGTGIGVGFLHFAVLYAGIAEGMPAGLASLVLQASAPFTVILAVMFLGERLTPQRMLGIGVAIAGLVLVGSIRAQVVHWWPVMLTVLAALSWACGNICIRKAQAPRPFHLALWMTVIPPVPLFLLSFMLESELVAPALRTAMTPEALPANLAMLFSAFGASVIGFGAWNHLLTRYSAASIAPLSMLVPVVGVLSGWIAFGEAPHLIELAGGALILIGILVINRAAPDQGTAREPWEEAR